MVIAKLHYEYAFSCTRFSAVRFYTNMGQVLFSTCFRQFSTCFLRTRFVSVPVGTVVLSWICIDLHRFSIDLSSISVVRSTLRYISDYEYSSTVQSYEQRMTYSTRIRNCFQRISLDLIQSIATTCNQRSNRYPYAIIGCEIDITSANGKIRPWGLRTGQRLLASRFEQ